MKGKSIARLLLVIGAMLVAASCGDPSPVGPENHVLRPKGDLLGGWPGLPQLPGLPSLARCTPLAYDSVTQVVGPEGGALSVGPHTLNVPPGALPWPVTITAVAPSDTVNWVRFQPQGLVFLQPATLTMSYANCSSLLPTPPVIAYVSDLLQILDLLPSLADPSSLTVTAHLRHFSGYAVDW